MPNLIDKEQLRATTQVAKSYILEQDTANVNTIINALQSGGGSNKQVPTLYMDNSSQIHIRADSVPRLFVKAEDIPEEWWSTWDRDAWVEISTSVASQNLNSEHFDGVQEAFFTMIDPYFMIFLPETDNFYSAVLIVGEDES